MIDKVSREKRSKIMRAIKSKDSKMECFFRKGLRETGYRGYRKNVSSLPGKPDIAFIGKRIAVFLDSCFWHGCPYHCRMPESSVEYWEKKIKRNKRRDKDINEKYRKMNWMVLRFWEHELSEKNMDKVIKEVKEALRRE